IANELPPLSELLPFAIQNREDYQAEKKLQERFQWEERAATRLRIPDPVFFVGIKRAEEPGRIAYGPYLGFSVSIPVFDRGQTRVAELEAELRRSGYREEILDQQIRSEVNGAYEVLQMRRQAEEEYRRQLEEQGPQLDRIAEVAYQEGEIGILELLDAYRVHRLSILRTLELTAASKQAEISLERAVGKPVMNQEVMP
ncbi:MAG: TolC family protein, partial [Acidobacteria bacterium]|nr:TolC family protein [Acidobacteriota bacterium]